MSNTVKLQFTARKCWFRLVAKMSWRSYDMLQSLMLHVWAAQEFSMLSAAARAKKLLEWFCIHSPKCSRVLGQMLKAELLDSGQEDPTRSSRRWLKRKGRCPQNEWDSLSCWATKTSMSSMANNKYARNCKSVLHCKDNLVFRQNKIMGEEQLS